MEFKGTKGKWSIYHRIDDNEENQYSVTSNNGKVCNCYNMSIPDYENKIAKANALLISKAPEMLEMLNKINITISIHGKIDSETELHYQLNKLIKESTEIN